MRNKNFICFLLCSVLAQGIAFPDTDEDKFISRIQSLESSYQISQNQELEKQLAKVYLDYAAYLKAQQRVKEARDYSAMAKTLGADVPESDLAQKEAVPVISAATLAAMPAPSPDGFAMQKAIVYHLFEDGIAAFKEKNYPLAEEQMNKVLKENPSNKYAHELLGDICYLTQRLNEAKAHWQQAMTRENMERINIKLSKVQKEIPVESKLKIADEEHFLIRYDRTQKEYSSYQLKTILREAYRSIYQDLGASLEEKIVVLLYDPEVFDTSVKTEHWSGALFDGKIRVPLKAGEETNEEQVNGLKKLIWHELGHVFVYEIGGKDVPLWMHEGIAQYEEDKIVPVPVETFQNLKAAGKIFSFSQLSLGSKLFEDDQSILLFYQESFLIMKFLIKRFGFYKISKLLKAIANGESMDSAFLSVLNLSPNELDRQWQVWQRQNV